MLLTDSAHSDTLLRHQALHGGEEAPSHGRRGPRVQACLSCAQLKQRCDGKKPCSRCSLRHAPCTYLASGTASSPARNPASPSGDIETESAGYTLNHAPDYLQDGDLSISASEPSTAVAPQFSSVCLRTSAWHGPNGICFCSDCSIGSITNESPQAWTGSAIGFPFPWAMSTWDMSLDDGSFFDLPDLTESSVGITAPVGATSVVTRVNEDTQMSVSTRNHTTPQYLAHENICGGYTTSCEEFPDDSPDNIQTAEAEMYGNISRIPGTAVRDLHQFYLTQQTNGAPSQIPFTLLHAFTELYFEHFDREFPCVHRSRLQSSNLSWVLLLATAAVGSQYSKVSDANRYQTVLADLLGRAIESKVRSSKYYAVPTTG